MVPEVTHTSTCIEQFAAPSNLVNFRSCFSECNSSLDAELTNGTLQARHDSQCCIHTVYGDQFATKLTVRDRTAMLSFRSGMIHPPVPNREYAREVLLIWPIHLRNQGRRDAQRRQPEL